MKWILRFFYVVILVFAGFIVFTNARMKQIMKLFNDDVYKYIDEDSTKYTDHLIDLSGKGSTYHQVPVYYVKTDTNQMKFDLKFYSYDNDSDPDSYGGFFVLNHLYIEGITQPRVKVALTFDGVEHETVYIDFTPKLESLAYYNYTRFFINKTDDKVSYTFRSKEGETLNANKLQRIEFFYAPRKTVDQDKSYVKFFEATSSDLRNNYTVFEEPTEVITALTDGIAVATLFDGNPLLYNHYEVTNIDLYHSKSMDVSTYNSILLTDLVLFAVIALSVTLVIIFRKKIVNALSSLFAKKRSDSDELEAFEPLDEDVNDKEVQIFKDNPDKEK